MAATRHKRIQQGLALVIVLWFLALLSVLAFGFSQSTHMDTKVARNLLDSNRALHLADAAVEKAIMRLLSPLPGDETTLIARQPVVFRFDDVDLSYNVTIEQGKIDINAAPYAMIRGLLQVLEVEEEQAEAISDSIIDWRDEDDLRRLNGAEEAEYLEAGMHTIPANAPFRSINELQQVLGMDADLYRKLEPHVTVHTFSDRINLQYASRETLLAIPGVDSAEVEALLDARQQLIEEQWTTGALPTLTGVDDWISDEAGQIYSIRGEAKLASGAAATRQRTILMLDDPQAPYYVLESGPVDPSGKIKDAGE